LPSPLLAVNHQFLAQFEQDRGSYMRRSAHIALSLAVILTISACAGGVDEELLPTRVPTLDPEALLQEAIAARPTDAPTATNTPEPLPDVSDTNTQPESPAEDATSDEDSAVIEYGGAAVSSLDTITETEDLSLADIAATEDLTETVEIDASQPITSTDILTVTNPLEDASDVLSASDTVTATGEAIEGGEDASSDVIAEANVAEAESTESDEPEDAQAADEGEQTPPAESNGATSDETAEEPTAKPTVSLPPSTPQPVETPEPEPTEEPAASVDPTLAGMPDSILDNMAEADPDNGESLTLSNACTGCHSLDPNQIMAGPTWYNLAERAADRVEGQSAGLYLYNSILHPNDYVVEGYQPNIMLQIYQDTLSEQDLADIISYLLTLQGR
jgi:hypothetical protein